MDILAYVNKINIFGLDIYFYAIIILCGALVALFLSAFRGHEKGYPWDMFNTIFLIALPCGIIGARIWFVIAEWEKFASNPIEMFNLRKGGLAIQGGALFGALGGIIYGFYRRKGVDLFQLADFAVPTILVAQAIGRWGNFFNQEVYGLAIDLSSWWLPSFIMDNMYISLEYRVPLFFLEGIVNLAGFILIGRCLPTLMGKYYRHGDQTFAYFIFYGIVRAILEPCRDAQFNMGGQDNLRAVYMAIAYIVVGVVLIVINHLVRMYLAKHPDVFTRKK